MFLHSLRLSYMQKSENSIARFSGKTSTERQRDRQRDRERETDPNSRGLRTLSLSRRTKKNKKHNYFMLFSFLANSNALFVGSWHRTSLKAWFWNSRREYWVDPLSLLNQSVSAGATPPLNCLKWKKINTCVYHSKKKGISITIRRLRYLHDISYKQRNT